ncbi:MAG: 1,6-anhydro-N-acetylmuramyl-L-alanine amidase AmpD [Gammaproteobacteria bacterium]|nr:1,6-anhydro-N-acetylmuramyl-L-alanine amidase AmpD [Gammaproteobacteria bacterium]MCW9006172.1 1,6-anhydro-N-acetylmuramyl-L-alanine amidase AmpD [Gammaproteobacteria bacterium]
MKINKKTGLIEDVEYIPSPNADDRPEDRDPELIVIHNISLPPGKFGGDYIRQLFTNSLNPNEHPYFQEIHSLHVSAHALIHRDGQITQFVPFNKRAWHAGVSCYKDKQQCNDFSIGIELEGTDDLPYETVQYRQLADMINALRKCYTCIEGDAITGHCDIAPDRKTDPGQAFDWDRLKQLLT